MKMQLSERLVQSGEKERLKELLRLELVQCGWHEEMKQLCKGLVDCKSDGIEKSRAYGWTDEGGMVDL